MKRALRFACVLVFNSVASTVAAVDLKQPIDGVTVSGFGTVGVSCYTDHTADYAATSQNRGPGRDGVCDAGLDSLLGLQVDWRLNDNWEVGVQSTAQRRVTGEFAPELNVAQLRWKPTEAWTFRLGRSPNPLFFYAESRKVHYAMPWARPPVEVYSLSPVFAADTVEALYRHALGNWRAEWHAGVLMADFPVPVAGAHDESVLQAAKYFGLPRPSYRDTADIRTQQGFIDLTLQDQHTSVKLGYMHGRLSYRQTQTNALLNTLWQSGDPLARQWAQALTVDDTATHVFTAGLRYERDDWLFLSEFGYRAFGGFIRDQYGAYASLGHQFGAWMPYATVARRWSNAVEHLPPASAANWQIAVDHLLDRTRYDSTSVALGLARELNAQTTLKLQTDWIQPDRYSWGNSARPTVDYRFADPRSHWLFTLNVDFVF